MILDSAGEHRQWCIHLEQVFGLSSPNNLFGTYLEWKEREGNGAQYVLRENLQVEGGKEG